MKAAVIGTGGAIGKAIAIQLAESLFEGSPSEQAGENTLYTFSRSATAPCANATHCALDYDSDTSIKQAAATVSDLDLVIVTTGILHGPDLAPEKALRDLDRDQLQQLFTANTIVPALLMKDFLPKLSRRRPATFAALSARVGSLSDNRLGGWYGYRASKTALNMMIKTASIEMTRKNENSVIVGLHPGTVDSPLSQPFQKAVPKEKLFTPTHSAQKLLSVIKALTPKNTGTTLDWAGETIGY